MAAAPRTDRQPAPWRLVPFDPDYAARVAEWCRGPHEAYWLAPQTPPPLTAEKVIGWRQAGRTALMMVGVAGGAPIGYGETNLLSLRRKEFWLGHVVLDPAWRGRGLGRELTRLLLRYAFGKLDARRVTLVVFPRNVAAVACYRSVGMIDDGYEVHGFAAYGTRERLLRMAVERRWFYSPAARAGGA